MALSDWYIDYINTSSIVVTGTSYEGTHYLDLSTGISGVNYDGTYILFPTNTSTSILTGGTVTWAAKNKYSNSKFGAIIRCDSPALTGKGYYVAVDHSYAISSRNLEIHKGYVLGNSISTLQTAIGISGGVSGSWYEYKADFHYGSGMNDVHIDVYTNEGTKDSPSWALQLAYTDASGYSPGYTGLLLKNPEQNYIHRVAGTGVTGVLNDTHGLDSKFTNPKCIAYDSWNNQYIIADAGNSIIRHMSPYFPYTTTTGVTGVSNMRSMCALNGYMWVKASDKIYKYDTTTNGITAVANTTGTNTDGDICTDGTDLYMTNGNADGRIIKMLGSTPYTFSDVAGHTHSPQDDADGTGTAAVLCEPFGITYDNGVFYFVGKYNDKLRKMIKSSTVVTTLGGGAGVSNDAYGGATGQGYFSAPLSVQYIGDNRLLIGDNGEIKMYDISTTFISTLCGDGNNNNTDGANTAASFGTVYHTKDYDPVRNNCMFFPSYDGHSIWRHPIKFQSRIVCGAGYATTVATGHVTNGTGRSAVMLNGYRGMRYYRGKIWYADNLDHVLCEIDANTWQLTIRAGAVGVADHVDATGTSARFNTPQGITVWNGIVYIAETTYLRAYNIGTGVVSTLLTRSPIPCTSVMTNGTYLYTGWQDGTIQRCSLTGGTMTKVVGNGFDIVDHSTGTSASCTWPNFSNDTWDNINNILYFADSCSIRKVGLTGTYPVTTIAGPTTPDVNDYIDDTGSAARFGWPEDLVIDAKLVNLYVADTYNYVTRKVALSNNAVTTYTEQGLAHGYGANNQIAAGWRATTQLYMQQAMTIAGDHLYINQYGNIIDVLIDDGGISNNIDLMRIKNQDSAGVIYDGFDGLPSINTMTNAYIEGISSSTVSISSLSHIFGFIAINISTLAYIEGLQPPGSVSKDSLSYIFGYVPVDISTKAYIDTSTSVGINTKLYVDGIAGAFVGSNAYVDGFVYSDYVYTGSYIRGYDSISISTNAYVDTSISISTSCNAYMWPIQLNHAISIPAYLNAEDYSSAYGTSGFSNYNTVIFTDLSYNRVTTLLCDYYLYPYTSSIVYNLFMINGTRYKVYDIKVITNSTWANRVYIQSGNEIQYLTASYDTTAIFRGPIDPDNAWPVTIVVESPGVTGVTIIPIGVIYS